MQAQVKTTILNIFQVSDALSEAMYYVKRQIEKDKELELFRLITDIYNGVESIEKVLLALGGNLYRRDTALKGKNLKNDLRSIIKGYQEENLGKIKEKISRHLYFDFINWRKEINDSLKNYLFQSRPRRTPHGKITIGYMDINPKEDIDFKTVSAYIASFHGVDFFHFTYKDIDFKRKKINGFVLHGDSWVRKELDYPDVIFDRLRMRGHQPFQKIYDEFVDIPFTNDRKGGSLSKLEAYDLIASSGCFGEYLIPYHEINDADIIWDYLDRYHKVVVKPLEGSFGSGVIYIGKLQDQYFEIIMGKTRNIASCSELSALFAKIMEASSEFLVQKYVASRTPDGYPFDIRVHTSKNRLGIWSLAGTVVRIGPVNSIVTNVVAGGSTCDLSTFFPRVFDKDKYQEFYERLIMFALLFSTYFESLIGENIDHIGLDLAVDEQMQIYLIEVNVNRVNLFPLFQLHTARHMVQYATYLAEKYLPEK